GLECCEQPVAERRGSSQTGWLEIGGGGGWVCGVSVPFPRDPLCFAGHLPQGQGNRIWQDIAVFPFSPWGEGGPKGRMRGHRLSLRSPPHPAAATFSPPGRRGRRHPRMPYAIALPLGEMPGRAEGV